MIYLLKTNCNETINRVSAININDAIIFFSKIKNLKKDVLVKLYNITEDN
jgi:hypothetical protein